MGQNDTTFAQKSSRAPDGIRCFFLTIYNYLVVSETELAETNTTKERKGNYEHC